MPSPFSGIILQSVAFSHGHTFARQIYKNNVAVIYLVFLFYKKRVPATAVVVRVTRL